MQTENVKSDVILFWTILVLYKKYSLSEIMQTENLVKRYEFILHCYFELKWYYIVFYWIILVYFWMSLMWIDLKFLKVKTCKFLHTLLMGEERFLQPSRKGNAWFHSVTPMIKHGYFVHINISLFIRSQSVPLRRNVTVQVLDQDRSQTPRGQSEPAFPSGEPGTSANVAAITAATIAATAPLIKVDIIRFI